MIRPMKLPLLLLILQLLLPSTTIAAETATKEDIRRVVEVMRDQHRLIEKRFEQIDRRFEQIDKHFEHIDKRFELVEKGFEQIDKRFEFIQSLLIALFIASIGSPFLVERYRQRRDQQDQEIIRGSDRLFAAMREAANHDPKLKEILSAARLL